MELTLRDWMVIVGVLLILAVLLDAGRRILRERRAEVRLKLSRSGQRGLDPEDLGVSTPRVVRRSDPPPDGLPGSRKTASTTTASTTERTQGPATGVPGEAESPTRSAEASQEDDASADEVVAAAPGKADRQTADPGGPRRGRRRAAGQPRREPTLSVDTAAPGAAPQPEPGPARAEPDPDPARSERQEPENLDWLDALDAEPDVGETDSDIGRLPRDIEPEVFMLNVVSRKPTGFSGEDVLHILLACDLRFGDMSFFHRHEQAAGRGPIQFSVANMLKPGVFDIDNMADFRTQGLTFFLTLPGPSNMMRAYDYMLETAQTVARNLDGDVLDETRSALTRQTLEHHRQRIRELERRLLLAQSSR